MGLGGVISNLLSLGAKLLPAVRDTTLQGSSSSSSSSLPHVDESQKIEAELEALMRMLERIKATLYDAEQREIRDKSVELWLKELKGVAFNAEDVLDEYRYEILRAQVEARETSPPDSRKRKLISVPDGMMDHIQEIKCRFVEIENHRIALQLLEEDGPRHSCSGQRAQTSHLVDESGIFGREQEKEKLISLLSSQCNDGKIVSVVAIVGIGGLGKTTLAQLAYKDLKDRRAFDEFGWVCVSENFDVERLTREMIESITRRMCTFKSLNALQDEVIKVIRRKRVLLVLDDVWNESRNHWEMFKVPFISATSVKILVTTRNKLVANIMQTNRTLNLCCLSEEQCWSLFKHHAIDGVNQHEGSKFEEIGKHIIRKCGMLPLAVKSIASMLRYEIDEESWREILESELWETDAGNTIFPPLQLSYARLPTYLKPCLIFCSMFPKDYNYDLQRLVELWISQGYIESKGKKSVKKIGFEYGKQLWQRSFFEGSNWMSIHKGWDSFKLHDIIHDLARLNSKFGCYSIEAGLSSKLKDLSFELINLYIAGFKKIIEPIPLENFKTLRTLIIVGKGFLAPDHSLPQKLRALEIDLLTTHELGFINQNHEFKFISSVGKLKHLCYLTLRNLPFGKLPECICSLYNLQYLLIKRCTINELPKNIGNLISLETLEISNCYPLKWLPESLCELKALRNLKIKYCEELQKLPLCMGNLVSLETLEISHCDLLEWLPKSLCELKALRNLKIESCKQLRKLPPSIGNLVGLKKLEISWCVLLERLPESLCQLKALSKLILLDNSFELPYDMGSLANLQSLHIENCGVKFLPPSMGKIVGIQSLCVRLDCERIGWFRGFHNLCRSLCLMGLENANLIDIQCANLVSMHNLESLKLDWSDEVPEEKEISLIILKGHEIYRGDDFEVMAGLQPHPNLRNLHIRNYGVSTFPEWIGSPSSCASLEILEIANCIKLRFLPFGSLCRLKYLCINYCDSLQILQAESLPPELQELCISDCEELISVPGIQGLKSLVKLVIFRCENLQTMFMDAAEPSLELTMRTNESSNQNLMLGLRNLTLLRNLEIGSCPKLHLLADELLCVDSCEVDVFDCPLLKEWCLQHGINYED